MNTLLLHKCQENEDKWRTSGNLKGDSAAISGISERPLLLCLPQANAVITGVTEAGAVKVVQHPIGGRQRLRGSHSWSALSKNVLHMDTLELERRDKDLWAIRSDQVSCSIHSSD